MILRDLYDGSDSPFEGDRELLLRHLPADARVVRARATVTPVDAGGAADPFAETIRFGGPAATWGATKVAAPGWVEVDFHARRTLAGVQGSNLSTANLLVDLGGLFVRPNQDGTLGPPVDLAVVGNPAGLPSLTVTRFRLTTAPPLSMDVTSVRVRSLPTNLTLALRGQPTFWFQAGELTGPATTPDFGLLLQSYLDDTAEVADGVFLLPFLLHSDSIARLAVEVEIEYLRRVSVLPGGVRDAVLPFDHGSLPRTGGLQVTLPENARVARGSGRAAGAFQGSRIAFGPTGEVTSRGELSVAPGSSPAHPVILPAAVEAVAVDLLLTAVTRTARLQLDLRQNLDGKPSGESFLPAPIPFVLDREMAGRPTWISVPLPAPFQFRAGQERTYWMVLQSLDGEALWSVESAAPALPPMQLTQDGGFSWRQAALPGQSALAGFFRLRYQPATFRMPIELQVGSGDAARRVDLSRFEPQGRVDLSFSDLPEVVAAFNQTLETGSRCPEVEHLANGGFEQWVRRGRQLGETHAIELEAATSQTRIAVSPDGRWAYVASEDVKANRVLFQAVDLDLEKRVESLSLPARSFWDLAIAPDGARAYVGLNREVASSTPPAEERVLQLIDLLSRQPLGGSLRIPVKNPHRLQALTLSPDGRRLYVALVEQSAPAPVPPEPDTPEPDTEPPVTDALPSSDAEPLAARAVPPSSIEHLPDFKTTLLAFDTALLDEAALRGNGDAGEPLPQEEVTVVAAVDLAASADGAWLYVLVFSVEGKDVKWTILVADAQTLRVRHDLSFPLELGKSLELKRMALAPDGVTAVVVYDKGVALVDLAGGRVLRTFNSEVNELAVAVEPDGSRVFVADEKGFRILDLNRRTVVVGPPTFNPIASDVAVTPAGDRVLVTDRADSRNLGPRLQVIPIGEVLPAEWAVTAGRVRRFTVAEAPGRFAVLGNLPEEEAAGQVLPGPSAISQVVPVAPCAYELSFQGLATVDDAVAEVFWRGGGCGLLRKDTVAIVAIDPAELSVTQPSPAFHRARLEAPAEATQAEVRFTAPAGAALVNDASLRATDAAVQAGELRGSALPDSWRRIPETASGFTIAAEGEGSRLSNLGVGEVALVRQLPAAAGHAFSLELQGRPVPAASTRSGRIELHWLAEGGAEAAPPAVFEVRPHSFDTLAAAGTVPAGTVSAELRLVFPAGTALEIRGLDLRFPAPAQVPVTFVAQAPGELAVLDWELLYDQVPMPRPRVPQGGLCPPTPPPLPAGAEGSDHGCCPGDDEDGGETVLVQPVAAPAPVLELHQLQPARQVRASSETVRAVRGIGKGRAQRLQKAGMASIEDLAASSPGTLRQVMPGISEKAAVGVILAAREKLRAPRGGQGR